MAEPGTGRIQQRMMSQQQLWQREVKIFTYQRIFTNFYETLTLNTY